MSVSGQVLLEANAELVEGMWREAIGEWHLCKAKEAGPGGRMWHLRKEKEAGPGRRMWHLCKEKEAGPGGRT